jgi:P27 family predicted phage terminase small subunit
VKRALGNPGQRPLPAAPTPEFALEVVKLDDVPNPPSTLGMVGLDAWDRIWSAGRRHLSDSQDRMLIERLCERMDLVAKLEAWLGEDVERRWYTTANGQVVTHPAVKQIDESDTKITTWLSMLGFSPSDRARLGLAEIRVANELDEYRQRKARVVDSVAVSND